MGRYPYNLEAYKGDLVLVTRRSNTKHPFVLGVFADYSGGFVLFAEKPNLLAHTKLPCGMDYPLFLPADSLGRDHRSEVWAPGPSYSVPLNISGWNYGVRKIDSVAYGKQDVLGVLRSTEDYHLHADFIEDRLNPPYVVDSVIRKKLSLASESSL